MINFNIFYILILAFFSNLVTYMIYKYYISKRALLVAERIKEYESKISSSSPKRRKRVELKANKELRPYYSRLQYYLFMQWFLLISIYFIDLFLIFFYLDFNVKIPVVIPYIKSNYVMLYAGSILIFVLAYYIFTPLSFRYPKLI